MPLSEPIRGLVSILANEYADLTGEVTYASFKIIRRTKTYEGVELPPTKRIAVQWLGIDWTVLGPRTEQRRANGAPFLAQLCVTFPSDLEELAPTLSRRLLPMQSWLCNQHNWVTLSEIVRDMPDGWPGVAMLRLLKAAHVWNRNTKLRQRLTNRLQSSLVVTAASAPTIAEWRADGRIPEDHQIFGINLQRVRLHRIAQEGWSAVPDPSALGIIEPLYLSESSEFLAIREGYRAGITVTHNYVILDTHEMVRDALSLNERPPYIEKSLEDLAGEVPYGHEPLLDRAVAYLAPRARKFLTDQLDEISIRTRATAAKELNERYLTLPKELQLNVSDALSVGLDTSRYVIVNRHSFRTHVESRVKRLRPKPAGTQLYRATGKREAHVLSLRVNPAGVMPEGTNTIGVAFKNMPVVDISNIPDIRMEFVKDIVYRFGGKTFLPLGALERYADENNFPALGRLVNDLKEPFSKMRLETKEGWTAAYRNQQQAERVSQGARVRGALPFTAALDQYLAENWKPYMREPEYAAMCTQFPGYTARHLRLRGRFVRSALRKGLTVTDLRDRVKVEAAFGKDLHPHRHVLACV